jgi:hypothetical protein
MVIAWTEDCGIHSMDHLEHENKVVSAQTPPSRLGIQNSTAYLHSTHVHTTAQMPYRKTA